MEEVKEYNSEFIIKLIRLHFEDQLSIDELSKRYCIGADLIVEWRKKLIEGANVIFSQERLDEEVRNEKKIRMLNERIKQKEKIIDELEKDNYELKKMLCNLDYEDDEEG